MPHTITRKDIGSEEALFKMAVKEAAERFNSRTKLHLNSTVFINYTISWDDRNPNSPTSEIDSITMHYSTGK